MSTGTGRWRRLRALARVPQRIEVHDGLRLRFVGLHVTRRDRRLVALARRALIAKSARAHGHPLPRQTPDPMLDEITLTCPYCWESIDTTIDDSAGDIDYVEDCQVCCQPIRIVSRIDPGTGALGAVEALREND